MNHNVSERNRFYWLDWLRFAAAFAVLVCHTRADNWLPYIILKEHYKNSVSWVFFELTAPGIAPVVVFFVLSGFLVGGKVLERVRNGTFDATSYALDRVSRIYVPLLPALLFTMVMCQICGRTISIGVFFGNLFGLQGLSCGTFGGNGPLWSLAYEFWFYVLACYFGLLFGSAYRVTSALLGVTLVFVIFTQFHASYLFCWCLGAFSHSLLTRHFKKMWFFVSLGLAVAAYGLLQLLSEPGSTNHLGSFLPSLDVGTLILSLGLAFIVPFIAQRPPRSVKLISIERAGTHLAAFSYTLYLTHYPMLAIWDHFLNGKFSTLSPHTFLWFVAKLSSCVLVAWLLYLPFEAQTARVRTWMKQRWTGRNIELYPTARNPAS
ncbi:MAG TPA: acyltransferase [Candidatus Acidoferrales bacterium]|nr:acyltransferase [Candidatus Acidoferrales bacterium]